MCLLRDDRDFFASIDSSRREMPSDCFLQRGAFDDDGAKGDGKSRSKCSGNAADW